MPDAFSPQDPPPRGATALSVTGLVKRYPNGVEALRKVDLEIETGEFFGWGC